MVRINREQIKEYTQVDVVPPTAADNTAAGYEDGATWLDSAAEEAYEKVGETAGVAVWKSTTISVGLLDLPGLQVRRTTTFPLPVGVFTNITFDVDDQVSTDATVIEHDSVNTERILIKETGLYFFLFMSDVDDEGLVQFVLNDTTVVPSSSRKVGDPTDVFDAFIMLGSAVLQVFNAGDYLTVQAQAQTGAEFMDVGATLMAVRLKGSKGDQGPPGAGSTVNAEDSGVAVPGGPFDTLNFGDGLTASDQGGGTLLVESPPGLPRGFDALDVAGGTSLPNGGFATIPLDTQRKTSAAFSHTLNTGVVTVNETDTYIVLARVTGDANSGTRTTPQVRVLLNGTPLQGISYGYTRNTTNELGTAVMFYVLDLTAGDTLTLQGGNETGGSLVAAAEGSSLAIVALRGPTGPQGAPGSATGELGYGESEANSTNATTVPALKLSVPFNSPAGDVMIEWYCEVNSTDSGTQVSVQVELDNTTLLADVDPNPETNQTTGYGPISGFRKATVAAGAHFVDIDFASTQGGNTVNIRRARVRITQA